MRWLPLLATPLLACALPPPPVGVLVADGIPNSADTAGGDLQMLVGPDHIFWAERLVQHAGADEVWCGALADTPLYTDTEAPLVDTDVPVALAGDRVLLSTEGELRVVACDGTYDTLATSSDPVTAVAFDAASGDYAWATGTAYGPSTTSSAHVQWSRGGVVQDIAIPGQPTLIATQLAFGNGALYASTDELNDGALWRIDAKAGAAVQLDRATRVAQEFPDDGFIDADRPGRPDYSAGELLVDGGGVMWSVLEQNHLGWFDRGLVMGYTDTGSTALAGPMYDTAAFRSDGTTLYWREDSADPATHYPNDCTPSLWTAPRAGGSAAFLRGDDVRVDTFVGGAGGVVYGFYDSDGDELAIRRADDAKVLVPDSPDTAVTCNAGETTY